MLPESLSGQVMQADHLQPFHVFNLVRNIILFAHIRITLPAAKLFPKCCQCLQFNPLGRITGFAVTDQARRNSEDIDRLTS
jgi:hypothetical protein